MRGETFNPEMQHSKEMPPQTEAASFEFDESEENPVILQAKLKEVKLAYVAAYEKYVGGDKMKNIGKDLDEDAALNLRAQVPTPFFAALRGKGAEVMDLYSKMLTVQAAVDRAESKEQEAV